MALFSCHTEGSTAVHLTANQIKNIINKVDYCNKMNSKVSLTICICVWHSAPEEGTVV